MLCIPCASCFHCAIRNFPSRPSAQLSCPHDFLRMACLFFLSCLLRRKNSPPFPLSKDSTPEHVLLSTILLICFFFQPLRVYHPPFFFRSWMAFSLFLPKSPSSQSPPLHPQPLFSFTKFFVGMLAPFVWGSG